MNLILLPAKLIGKLCLEAGMYSKIMIMKLLEILQNLLPEKEQIIIIDTHCPLALKPFCSMMTSMIPTLSYLTEPLVCLTFGFLSRLENLPLIDCSLICYLQILHDHENIHSVLIIVSSSDFQNLSCLVSFSFVMMEEKK